MIGKDKIGKIQRRRKVIIHSNPDLPSIGFIISTPLSGASILQERVHLIKGILWDMDGVLFDTGEIHYQSWTRTLPEYGISFDRETFKRIFGMKNAEIIPQLAGKPLPGGLVTEIGDRKEWVFRQMIRGSVELLPGARDWLERFASWRLPQAVASSAPRANVDALLEETGIGDFFSAVISVEGLPGKPDPAIFLTAAAAIGILPQEGLVIEDAASGVEAAKRAGMRCIAVTTTNPAEVLKKADLIVDRLDQLSPEMLEPLGGNHSFTTASK